MSVILAEQTLFPFSAEQQIDHGRSKSEIQSARQTVHPEAPDEQTRHS